jgi:hypothetical protein
MCTLGCYDIVAKRLQPSSLARHVLPGIVPLLDEKSLNAKQFEMVVARVNSMIQKVVSMRRSEVGNLRSIHSELDDTVKSGSASMPLFPASSHPAVPPPVTTPSYSLTPLATSTSPPSEAAAACYSWEESSSSRCGGSINSEINSLDTGLNNNMHSNLLMNSTFGSCDNVSEMRQQMSETRRQIEMLQNQLGTDDGNDPFAGL